MRGFPIIAAALLALAPAHALAQQDETDDTDVLEAVNGFMTAFNAQDAAAMSAQALDGAMVTVIEEREGEDRAQMVPLKDLIASISSAPADIEEPIWGEVVMQEGPVASVVANFEFLIDGMRSHCGTNVFNLIRVDGEWKIAGIAYSHIEEGCLAAPDSE